MRGHPLKWLSGSVELVSTFLCLRRALAGGPPPHWPLVWEPQAQKLLMITHRSVCSGRVRHCDNQLSLSLHVLATWAIRGSGKATWALFGTRSGVTTEIAELYAYEEIKLFFMVLTLAWEGHKRPGRDVHHIRWIYFRSTLMDFELLLWCMSFCVWAGCEVSFWGIGCIWCLYDADIMCTWRP